MNRIEGKAHNYLTAQPGRNDTTDRIGARRWINTRPILTPLKQYPESDLDELAQDPPRVYGNVAERFIRDNIARRETLAREEMDFLRRSGRLVRYVKPDAQKG